MRGDESVLRLAPRPPRAHRRPRDGQGWYPREQGRRWVGARGCRLDASWNDAGQRPARPNRSHNLPSAGDDVRAQLRLARNGSVASEQCSIGSLRTTGIPFLPRQCAYRTRDIPTLPSGLAPAECNGRTSAPTGDATRQNSTLPSWLTPAECRGRQGREHTDPSSHSISSAVMRPLRTRDVKASHTLSRARTTRGAREAQPPGGEQCVGVSNSQPLRAAVNFLRHNASQAMPPCMGLRGDGLFALAA